MTMRAPTVDIVIVDYNVGDCVLSCVQSIWEHQPLTAHLNRVVVVDNASDNPTSAYLKGFDAEIIRNETNRGFAAACNQGAHACQSEFLLFLNPDTRILQGSLDVPVSFLNQNDDYGISGVQLLDDDGIPSPTCSRFPRPSHFFWRAIGLQSWAAKRGWSTAMVEWKHDADRDVDYVMGAFFVIRKELFQKLGGFDERFFVYFEETDLAYRVKQAGYKTRFLAGARAYHSAGISSGKVKAHRLFYSVRSRLLYGYKHWGRCATAALLAESLVLEPVARCARAALKLSAKEIREVLDGYRMLWRDLGNWRSTIQRHSEEDREARRSDR